MNRTKFKRKANLNDNPEKTWVSGWQPAPLPYDRNFDFGPNGKFNLLWDNSAMALNPYNDFYTKDNIWGFKKTQRL